MRRVSGINNRRRPRRLPSRGLWALLIVLAMALVACGGGDPSADDPVETAEEVDDSTAEPGTETESTESTEQAESLGTVRYTQAGTSLSFANVLYAQAAGFFEDEGLEMEYMPFPPSSGDVITILVAGDADVGFAAPSAMYSAVSQGRDLQNYATAQKGPALGITVSAELAEELEAEGITPDSPVLDRIAALEGKNIASVGAGSSTYAMAVMALDEAGLSADSDVTFLPVPDHAEAANSTRQGQADAYVAALPALLTGPTEGWGVLWLEFPEVSAIGDMPWIEMTTSTEYAEANPEIMEAMLRAVWRANDDFENNPEEVARVLKEEWYQDMDQELFDAAFEMARPTFTKGLIPTEEGLAASIAVTNAGAEVPVELTFDEVYDTRFVEETAP